MNLALAIAVTLTWHASPTPGVTSYSVWRAKGSCSAAFVQQATTPKTSITLSEPSGTYCYKITANAKKAQSAASNAVLLTAK